MTETTDQAAPSGEFAGFSLLSEPSGGAAPASAPAPDAGQTSQPAPTPAQPSAAPPAQNGAQPQAGQAPHGVPAQQATQPGNPGAPVPGQPPAEQDQRQIPYAALKEEREARRAAQAEALQMRGYIQAMQQQAALAQQQQRQQPAAPPPAPTPIPDPALDPEGYHRHMQEQFAERERHMAGVAEQQAAETRFDTSVMVHSQRIGSENVASVAEWVRKQGDDVGTWFSNQRDPIGAAIQAYQKSAVQAEIGNDPAAYWQQRETAIQAHAMERARAELTQQMRAGAPAPLIPPSLATQTRSSPNGAPEVMGTDRDFVRGFLSERRAR